MNVEGHTGALDIVRLSAAVSTWEWAAEDLSTAAGIPVTDVDFKLENDIHTRKSSGDVLWIASGRKSDLFNASGDPIRFTIVRFQTDAK